jgi:hypothetical protein
VDRYSYCALYVRGATTDAVIDLVVRVTAGRPEGRVVYIRGVEVEVRRNPDGADGADDFVYWPVKVEIEPSGPVTPDLMRDVTARVLASIWPLVRML